MSSSFVPRHETPKTTTTKWVHNTDTDKNITAQTLYQQPWMYTCNTNTWTKTGKLPMSFSWWIAWLLLHSTILCFPSRLVVLQSHASLTDCSFLHGVFWISTEVACLQRCLVVTWLVPCKTAAVLVPVLYTPCNHVPVYSVIIESHMWRVSVRLAVTCHLHFWQNGWVCVCVRMCSYIGMERISKISQHRKLALDFFIPSPLLGIKPATFQSQVQCYTTELSPLPESHHKWE